ncbi:uncharacterized protein C2845_PM07G05110 [Panicum miliaceum]|uniref:Uncharacterized protein n=1 Tax=Panicum miliaceum TaxID=4540 RepID=A0A3L6SPT5_PANMI|nr:uncharacterized protein C2845_PM07G05110 [Panicum miliaceum]
MLDMPQDVRDLLGTADKLPNGAVEVYSVPKDASVVLLPPAEGTDVPAPSKFEDSSTPDVSEDGIEKDTNLEEANTESLTMSAQFSASDLNGDMSATTKQFDLLTLHEGPKSYDDNPTVIIPDHLQVSNADCAHLTFDSFVSGTLAASLTTKPLECHGDVATGPDDQSIDQTDVRKAWDYLKFVMVLGAITGSLRLLDSPVVVTGNAGFGPDVVPRAPPSPLPFYCISALTGASPALAASPALTPPASPILLEVSPLAPALAISLSCRLGCIDAEDHRPGIRRRLRARLRWASPLSASRPATTDGRRWPAHRGGHGKRSREKAKRSSGIAVRPWGGSGTALRQWQCGYSAAAPPLPGGGGSEEGDGLGKSLTVSSAPLCGPA